MAAKDFALMWSTGHYASVWKDEDGHKGIYEILVIINEPNTVTPELLSKICECTEYFMASYSNGTAGRIEDLISEISKLADYGVQVIVNPNYYNG